MSFPILTGLKGTNADLFPLVLEMYVEHGAVVADVTYGHGVFWRNIPEDLYALKKSDLQDGIDFRNLPYEDSTFDALVFDPPYMHGGGQTKIKDSIDKRYKNNDGITGHPQILERYLSGIIEARRVLRSGGILIVKCQGELASGQKMTHVELQNILPLIGWTLEDEFVLVQNSTPAMRNQYQKHARKNHSYFLVFRKRGKVATQTTNCVTDDESSSPLDGGDSLNPQSSSNESVGDE